MARGIIRTDGAPSSPLYSQGVRAGETIHVSGMPGIDPETGRLAGPTIQEQARQALANCANVVAAGGGSIDDVVEVGVLLTSPEDFAGLNEVFAEVFPVDPPTRYVAKLGVVLPDVLVSIRMTAVLGGA
ncbi:MAG TPA: Rid family hydrolase [Nocardioides sp.]|jgi:2-iminobutanoate/2-iminopropanoate deaminase|nr:Rid family hydrolase [Nocardioides sp.]